MKRWFHRLRGLLGLGTLGGFLGAGIGGGWFLVESLMGGPEVFMLSLTALASIWGLLGAATGVGFGMLLTATSGRRRLEEVSLWRAGFLGAAAGAVCPLLAASLIVGSAPPLGIGLWFVGIGGCFGGGLGAGLLQIAKGAQDAEHLPSAEADRFPKRSNRGQTL
ncbi:MAG: hypothetical protein HKN72_10250 [Gemmatimonadetes bacterium]|nr:hypothetical protein [Gemmatimonadota bacterium]NNF13598.1 hypothetical protein [Gemmatimonadota bacterium]